MKKFKIIFSAKKIYTTSKLNNYYQILKNINKLSYFNTIKATILDNYKLYIKNSHKNIYLNQ